MSVTVISSYGFFDNSWINAFFIISFTDSVFVMLHTPVKLFHFEKKWYYIVANENKMCIMATSNDTLCNIYLLNCNKTK